MKPTSQPHNNWNDQWAAWLMESLYAQGVRLCCISPGSRSTPLTAAAARHPKMETRIFWDERNAAFFALGYGRATGQIAPLICTSGTAAANYYPAVIEASVDHVPMLVLSADRPPELQHTGANQTIDQPHLFGTYPRWFHQFPCPTPEIPQGYVQTTIAQAVTKATRDEPGPVHLNLPFRKPLGPEAHTPTGQSAQTQAPLLYPETVRALNTGQITALGQELSEARRGLLIIGRLPGHTEIEALKPWLDGLPWPVCVDPGAALAPGHLGTGCISHFDLLLRHRRFSEKMKPDVIVHLGGPLMSKALQDFVAGSRGSIARYIHIHPWGERIDPDHMVTHRIQADIGPVGTALATWRQQQPKHQPDTTWQRRWQRADQDVARYLIDAFKALETAAGPVLEPEVARCISELASEEHAIIVGNSMPIRHMAAFGQSRGTALRPFANRGASGIDGLLSTAMGVVEGSQRPGLLYLGDLSLIHNLNALLWLRERQLPLVIIVANNHGGGIFGHLPIARCEDIFASHFHTPHGASLSAIATATGIESYAVTQLSAFREALGTAMKAQAPVLIEILTESQRDLTWQRQLIEGLQERDL